jgi:predicted amidohydrolase
MHTLDRKVGVPFFDRVREVPIDWNFDKPRVAFAQLDHIGRQAYIETKYRIRQHSSCSSFKYLLSVKLMELEARCRRIGPNKSGRLLDLLVFPEVFVPRSFLGTLQGFSDRVGAMVIAGVDYPEGEEESNANEYAVICPGHPTSWYRKITRSQYDAHRNNVDERMPMRRGEELLRLVGAGGRGIGVLICYDYSHFDLMWSLNLNRRDMPLDLTVVVAHNPFGELYRSCCIADAHRFYQFVLMCNVAEYGGSGVFGPLRAAGARQVLADAAKGVETVALVDLDLGELHTARHSLDQGLYYGKLMRRPGVFQRRWP